MRKWSRGRTQACARTNKYKHKQTHTTSQTVAPTHLSVAANLSASCLWNSDDDATCCCMLCDAASCCLLLLRNGCCCCASALLLLYVLLLYAGCAAASIGIMRCM